MGVSVWRQRQPQAPLRERVTGWRARNWRRAILTWFVLTLAIMAVAAEPVTAFPKAQLNSVPAARKGEREEYLRGAQIRWFSRGSSAGERAAQG